MSGKPRKTKVRIVGDPLLVDKVAEALERYFETDKKERKDFDIGAGRPEASMKPIKTAYLTILKEAEDPTNAMAKTVFYRCPDDNFEFASTKDYVRCRKCGSLNLERYLGSCRWIKADAADVPENARLIHIGAPPHYCEEIMTNEHSKNQ